MNDRFALPPPQRRSFTPPTGRVRPSGRLLVQPTRYARRSAREQVARGVAALVLLDGDRRDGLLHALALIAAAVATAALLVEVSLTLLIVSLAFRATRTPESRRGARNSEMSMIG